MPRLGRQSDFKTLHKSVNKGSLVMFPEVLPFLRTELVNFKEVPEDNLMGEFCPRHHDGMDVRWSGHGLDLGDKICYRLNVCISHPKFVCSNLI